MAGFACGLGLTLSSGEVEQAEATSGRELPPTLASAEHLADREVGFARSDGHLRSSYSPHSATNSDAVSRATPTCTVASGQGCADTLVAAAACSPSRRGTPTDLLSRQLETLRGTRSRQLAQFVARLAVCEILDSERSYTIPTESSYPVSTRTLHGTFLLERSARFESGYETRRYEVDPAHFVAWARLRGLTGSEVEPELHAMVIDLAEDALSRAVLRD